jgi:lipopolysaccharide export system permease protein
MTLRQLDRYLLGRFALSLALSIVGLLLIAVVVDLTESLDTFIDHRAAVGQVLVYYAYHAPYWMALTLPVAALLGTLFTLTSLARSNEIAAMKALGVGLHRLLLPMLLSALGFSVAAFWFTDQVVPEATYRSNAIRDEMAAATPQHGFRRHVVLQDVDGQFVNARTYDSEARQALGLCWEQLASGRAVARVTAETLAWRGDHWLARRGRRFDLQSERTISSAFDSLALRSLTLRPDDLAQEQRRPEEMTYAELRSLVKRATVNGEDATRQIVDLHLKVSFPMTCFVIVLLGAPLGANAPRAGLANRFGIGVLVCLAFYGCVKGGQALAWNHVLPPWLGAWAANLTFGALGIGLLGRAHT